MLVPANTLQIILEPNGLDVYLFKFYLLDNVAINKSDFIITRVSRGKYVRVF